MKKLLLATVVFSALFTAQVQPAYACSCIMPGTPQEEMVNAEAVFSGKVLEIEEVKDGYAVALQVIESWKGVDGSTIQVHTGMGGGDCGFNFEEGKEYMVYASSFEGTLEVYICSLTGLLAESDTESLGAGVVTPEDTSEQDFRIIYGVGALVIVLAAVAYAIKSNKQVKHKK
jgi:hypothetical protein